MKRRNTKSKQEVLDLLSDANGALSHEMIQGKITSKTDRATIYRVLNSFCEDGIAHKIIADDGKQYFALCISCTDKNHNHNHFHFRCTQCGQVSCLKTEIEVILPKGFHSESFNGLISGRCNVCSA